MLWQLAAPYECMAIAKGQKLKTFALLS